MRTERQRRSGTEPKVGAQRLPWVEGTNEISTPTGLCPIARSSSCGRNQMTNNARDVSESSRNPVGVSVLPVCTPTQRSLAVAGQRWALGRSPVGAQKCPNSSAGSGDSAYSAVGRVPSRGGICGALDNKLPHHEH